MSLRKLLFGLISFSNLAVLSLVFGVYFQNNYQTSKMYSTTKEGIGTKESDIKNKIQKQCGKELQNVIEGKRLEFICGVSIKGNEKGSSYVLRTKVILKKSNDGFSIEGTGSMNSKTRYATEADFCDSCKEEVSVTSSDKDTVFEQIFDIAKTIDQKAASSVINAKEVYRQKDLEKRRALLKQKKCKGEWSEDQEEFVEYDSEEALDCKISRLDEKDFFEKETYYNDTLKEELWELALSDDYDLLDKSILGKLQRTHFNKNLSVQNSTGFIGRYVDWKNSYEDKGLSSDVEFELNSILKDLRSLNSIDKNLTSDYQYITRKHTPSIRNNLPSRGHWNPSARDSTIDTIPSSPISLKNQVNDLY